MNQTTRLDDRFNALLVVVALVLAIGFDLRVFGDALFDRGEAATASARVEAPVAADTTALTVAVEVGPLLR